MEVGGSFMNSKIMKHDLHTHTTYSDDWGNFENKGNKVKYPLSNHK